MEPGETTINDLLKDYYSTEVLTDANMFKCEGCESRQKVTKRLRMHTVPTTMVIHLKRLLLTTKVEHAVPFFQEMDISNFLSCSGRRHSVAGIFMQLLLPLE